MVLHSSLYEYQLSILEVDVDNRFLTVALKAFKAPIGVSMNPRYIDMTAWKFLLKF